MNLPEKLKILKQLQASGLGNISVNTLEHYYNVYLTFKAHHKTEPSKMQCYENTAVDCYSTSESVHKIVKKLEKILDK